MSTNQLELIGVFLLFLQISPTLQLLAIHHSDYVDLYGSHLYQRVLIKDLFANAILLGITILDNHYNGNHGNRSVFKLLEQCVFTYVYIDFKLQMSFPLIFNCNLNLLVMNLPGHLHPVKMSQKVYNLMSATVKIQFASEF